MTFAHFCEGETDIKSEMSFNNLRFFIKNQNASLDTFILDFKKRRTDILWNVFMKHTRLERDVLMDYKQ